MNVYYRGKNNQNLNLRETKILPKNSNENFTQKLK
jgi:hypothetical protein